MAKLRSVFICQNCGFQYSQWQGKCFQCGSWNSLVEEIVGKASLSSNSASSLAISLVPVQSLANPETKRLSFGFEEFDQVLGGGLVPGEVVLLGGEPGIGKSTLILQITQKLSSCKILYFSAEESVWQIQNRLNRLGYNNPNLFLASENDIDVILATIKKNSSPSKEADTLIIIDSVQTIKTSDLSSTPGSISQVQECSRRLLDLVKKENLMAILVGQVTKEGNLAGPKALEHMVDAVLYLEGDRFLDFRILRGIKNRFGSVNEVGLFKMTENGLNEVKNPSAELLENRKVNASGSVLTVILEGVRPLIVEVQALTSATSFGLPRRTVNGVDYNRLLMLLAVLQKRLGLNFGNQDVYISLTGGFKTNDPSVDLAICLSLASSLKNKPLDKRLVAIAEVDLLGNLKKTSQLEKRGQEARRLGFERVVSSFVCSTIGEAIERVGLG